MRLIVPTAALLLTTLAVRLAAADAPAPKALPPPLPPEKVLAAFAPGQGREVTAKACGLCHAPLVITGKHFNADEWAQVVDHMVDKGAQVKDDDYDAIVDYLAKFYGKGA